MNNMFGKSKKTTNKDNNKDNKMSKSIQISKLSHEDNRGWEVRYCGGIITCEYSTRWIREKNGQKWSKKGTIDEAKKVAELGTPCKDFDYYRSQDSVRRGSEICGWVCRSTGREVR